MRSNWSDERDVYTPYETNTESSLFSVTAPIPIGYLPRESWSSRFWRAVRNVIIFIIYKIYQLLGLALAVLLLLLFTHFLLNFFGITTSLFAHWISLLSAPLLLPFNNLLPPLPYGGYMIDVSTLIAIVVYSVAVAIVRQFLKVLVS